MSYLSTELLSIAVIDEKILDGNWEKFGEKREKWILSTPKSNILDTHTSDVCMHIYLVRLHMVK